MIEGTGTSPGRVAGALVLSLSLAGFSGQKAHPQTAADSAAIMQAVRNWEQAWNNADVGHNHHLRVFERRDGRWLIVSHLISQARENRGPTGPPSGSEPGTRGTP